jgi:hypothetical protein
MADFYQNGIITTLHNLSHRPLEAVEAELSSFSRVRPMGLLLPCLYSELEGEALPRIVDHLAQVPYLSQIVIGLDQANEPSTSMPWSSFPDCRSRSVSCGTTARASVPWTPSWRRWIWRRGRRARAGTSGTAWAICSERRRSNPLPFTTAIS